MGISISTGAGGGGFRVTVAAACTTGEDIDGARGDGAAGEENDGARGGGAAGLLEAVGLTGALTSSSSS